MNKENIVIPSIFFGFVLLTSMIPVIQVILMTLNGGLTYIMNIPFDNNNLGALETTGIVFNGFLTVFALFLFYNANKTWTRFLTTLLVLFFGQGLMIFNIDKFLKEDDSYYIYWIVLSGTPILMTLMVGLYKNWNLNPKRFTKI